MMGTRIPLEDTYEAGRDVKKVHADEVVRLLGYVWVPDSPSATPEAPAKAAT